MRRKIRQPMALASVSFSSKRNRFKITSANYASFYFPLLGSLTSLSSPSFSSFSSLSKDEKNKSKDKCEAKEIPGLVVKHYQIYVGNERLSLRRIQSSGNEAAEYDDGDEYNVSKSFMKKSKTRKRRKTPPVILMIPGAIENSNIYFSRKGKGLGAYLALEGGCDVFLLDHAGRGLSTPQISSSTLHGQHEMITRDIPIGHLAVKFILDKDKQNNIKMINTRKDNIHDNSQVPYNAIRIDESEIEKINTRLSLGLSTNATSDGDQVQAQKAQEGKNKIDEEKEKETAIHWIAHSWGGVLCSSALLRYPHLFLGDKTGNLTSQIWIGTKRTISVSPLSKLFAIDFCWNFLFKWLSRPSLVGYLPAKKLKLGSENEPGKYIREVGKWVQLRSSWKDVTDNFHYDPSIFSLDSTSGIGKRYTYPPTFSLTGSNDAYLGNQIDVKRFIEEHGPETQKQFTFGIIGKGDKGLLERYEQTVKDKDKTDADKTSTIKPREIALEIQSKTSDVNFSRDYGHVDILTHKHCEKDHYQLILDWINEKS